MNEQFYISLGMIISYAVNQTETPEDNKVANGLTLALEVSESETATIEDAGAAAIVTMQQIAATTHNPVDDVFAERFGKIEKIMRKGGYTKNGFLDYAKIGKQLFKIFKDIKKLKD